MGEIIELEQFRRKLAADQGFRTWLSRFREKFGPQTRLADLSPSTLLFLATPGEEPLFALIDLVMGTQGWGSSARFLLDDLDRHTKQGILDAALRLLDYCRFEILWRLGWITKLPASDLPLVDLVELLLQGEAAALALPELAATHPAQSEYQQLIPSDRQVFIRRLIPAALQAFRRQLEEENPPA